MSNPKTSNTKKVALSLSKETVKRLVVKTGVQTGLNSQTACYLTQKCPQSECHG